MSSGPVLTGVSEIFTEATRAMTEPVCPPTTDGSTPSLVEVFEVGAGESVLVWSEEPTQAHKDYEQEFGDLCRAMTCFLDLVQVSTGLSCFGLEETCDGWMTSPTRDADYSCLYGGVSQPVQECYIYANVFSQEKRLAGNAWADAQTGEDLGGGTSLRFDEELMGLPGRGPDVVRGCGGDGWGEPNPLEWVLRPIQCALEWAFVPRSSAVMNALESVDDAFAGRAPGQIVSMVNGWTLAPLMTGCKIVVDYPDPITHTTTPLTVIDACPGSLLEPVAATSRVLTTLAMVVLVVIATRRAVAATVGYGDPN